MGKFYDRLLKIEIFGKTEMDGTDDDIYAIIGNDSDPESKYLINGEDAMEVLMAILEQLEKSDEDKETP